MKQACAARIAVIGGGKMGEAIMGGWIASLSEPASTFGPDTFIVADPGRDRCEYLRTRYQVMCTADARSIEGPLDVVVLAVKPQVMMSVLEGLAGLPAYEAADSGPLFVSIAAGLSTERLEAALPPGARLVRVMPNTPLLVGSGATAVAAGSRASSCDVRLVHDLFACLGEACVVDEGAMDAIGAISGSGPAYVAALIEALRDAGVKQGLDAALAESLALQTVYGTATLMKETGQDPATTRAAVCSPGGTTLAALAAMDEAGFSHVFDAGVAAAVCRSKELAAC